MAETAAIDEWFGDDHVRVAEYWERRPSKRTLALLPDGSIDDVTDQPERLKELKAKGVRIEERESMRVYRSVISSCHLLEERKPWPGRFIPIVPVVGEEVNIGRRTMRHGIVRYLKDPQRRIQLFQKLGDGSGCLAAEGPMACDREERRRLRGYVASGEHAELPLPALHARSEERKRGASAGELGNEYLRHGRGATALDQEMKEITGIYDAALGQRSNEVSGKAIQARNTQSQIGAAAYVENFSRAIKHTGRILLDLIPNIYDAQRTIRIVGEDGKVDLVAINQQVMGLDHVLNDVTVQAYDVVLDQGPSYNTKREQSAESHDDVLAAGS